MSHQPFSSATPPGHLLPRDGPHLEGWAEERFGPCRCYLLIEATTPVLTLSLTHKAGVTDDMHTKSHIANTLTPAPSLIQSMGKVSSDRKDRLS